MRRTLGSGGGPRRSTPGRSLLPPERLPCRVWPSALVSYAPSGFNPGGFITRLGLPGRRGGPRGPLWRGRTCSTDVVSRCPRPVWDNPAVIDQARRRARVNGTLHLASPMHLSASGLHGSRPTASAFAYRRLGPPGELPAVPPPAPGSRPTSTTPTGPPPSSSAPTGGPSFTGVTGGRGPGEHGSPPGDPGRPAALSPTWRKVGRNGIRGCGSSRWGRPT